MAQHRSNARSGREKLDHHVVPFPTPNAPPESVEVAASSPHGQATSPRVRVRRRAAAQVTVLEVAGRLSDVVDELDQAIQLALAGGPRGVVCDLTTTLAQAEPVAVGVVATAGRHVQDWPGIPVAVACPDPAVRQALRADPVGGYLIVTESVTAAVAAVQQTPYLMVQSLRLAAHPTAPRACREFLGRTLVAWRLSQVIPLASLVISELVISSSTHAGTEIKMSVVWDRGALRLAVADHGPALPGQPSPSLDLRGRGLNAVAALSSSFGALPTCDGGQVLWAVLEAARS